MVYQLTTASQRLAALQLAARTGNVSEACRLSGVDRTSFYRWRKRYAAMGEMGLSNRSRAHHSHPGTLPKDTEIRVLTQSMRRPWWSCQKLSQHLGLEGHAVSPSSVQTILRKHGLASKKSRMKTSEEAWFGPGLRELFDRQYEMTVQRGNPRRKPSEWKSVAQLAQWYVDCLTLPQSWQLGPTEVLFAMELGTGYVCAKLCFEPLDVDRLRNFLSQVLHRNFVKQRERRHIVEFAPRLKPFLEALPSIYGEKSFTRFIHGGSLCASGPDPTWLRLLLALLRQSPPPPGIGSLQVYTRALARRIHAYNESLFIQGFPHFGRTPGQLWRDPTFQTASPLNKLNDPLLHRILYGEPIQPDVAQAGVQTEAKALDASKVKKCLKPACAADTALLTQLFTETGGVSSPVEKALDSPSDFAPYCPPASQPCSSSLPLAQFQPYYMNKQEDIFSAIQSTGPRRYTLFICGSCVRLLVKDKASKHGVCPLTQSTVHFQSAACSHYLPRGESL